MPVTKIKLYAACCWCEMCREWGDGMGTEQPTMQWVMDARQSGCDRDYVIEGATEIAC